MPRPSQRRLTVKKLWVRFDSNRSKKPLLFTLLSMFKRKYYPLTYVSYRRQNMSKWLNEFVKSCVISKYSNIPVRAKGLLPCFGLSACTILANTWPCPPARHHSAAEHKAYPYLVIFGTVHNSQRRRVAPPFLFFIFAMRYGASSLILTVIFKSFVQTQLTFKGLTLFKEYWMTFLTHWLWGE